MNVCDDPRPILVKSNETGISRMDSFFFFCLAEQNVLHNLDAYR